MDEPRGVGGGAIGEDVPRLHEVEIVVHSDRQLALLSQGLKDGHVLGLDADILHAGPPARRVKRHGLAGGLTLLGEGRGRQLGIHQSLGVVHQHAGGLAGCVAQDLAAGRIGGVLGDPGQGQHLRIGHDGMAVGTAQHHPSVWHGGVQVGAGGEALLRPMGLDPTPAVDHVGSRMGVGPRLKSRGEFRRRHRALEIEGQFAETDADQVGVGIHEARIGGGALEVDILRLGPGLAGGGQRAGEGHLAVMGDDGLDLRRLGAGIDRPAVEQEVGRLRARAAAPEDRHQHQPLNKAPHERPLKTPARGDKRRLSGSWRQRQGACG